MRPDVRWGLGLVLAFAATVAVAALLRPVLLPLLASAPVLAADDAVASALRAALGPEAMAVMRAASLVFGNAPVVAAALAFAVLLAWRGLPDRAAHWLACVPLGMMLNAAVKLAVQRPRPDVPWAHEALASFSFPSGHTAQATLLAGAFLLHAWPRLRGTLPRALAACAAVAVVLLVGCSRIALGAHHFSDCVASVAEAVLWLAWCTATAPAGFVPRRGSALQICTRVPSSTTALPGSRK